MGAFTSKDSHSGHIVLQSKSSKTTFHTNSFGTLQILPDEIFVDIFSYLTWREILLLSRVSRSFFFITLDDKLWKKLYDDHLWLSLKQKEISSLSKCCWKKQFMHDFLSKDERTARRIKEIDSLQGYLNELKKKRYFHTPFTI